MNAGRNGGKNAPRGRRRRVGGERRAAATARRRRIRAPDGSVPPTDPCPRCSDRESAPRHRPRAKGVESRQGRSATKRSDPAFDTSGGHRERSHAGGIGPAPLPAGHRPRRRRPRNMPGRKHRARFAGAGPERRRDYRYRETPGFQQSGDTRSGAPGVSPEGRESECSPVGGAARTGKARAKPTAATGRARRGREGTGGPSERCGRRGVARNGVARRAPSTSSAKPGYPSEGARTGERPAPGRMRRRS